MSTNSQFAGIDFSQYQSWEKIVAPTGAVYYKVPGTGYVYDPFLSAAKGRPVLWTNPQPAVDEKNKADKAAKDAASPLAQLTPMVGTIGGTVAGTYAIDQLKSPVAQTFIKNPNGNGYLVGMSNGQLKDPVTGTIVGNGPPEASVASAPAAGPAQAVGPTQAFTNAATGAPGPDLSGATPLRQNIDGTITMSDGSVTPAPVQSAPLPGTGAAGAPMTPGAPDTPAPNGSFLDSMLPNGQMPIQQGLTMGNVLAAAGTAKGAYDTFNAFQNGGQGARTGLTEMGAGIGQMVAGPVGAFLGAAGGNLLGYGLKTDGVKGYGALAASGIGIPLIPFKAAADLLGIDIFHKTTKQYQQERWGAIANDDKASDYWKNQAVTQSQAMNSDMRGKMLDGSDWTLEKATDAIKGGDAANTAAFRGVLGHQQVYGNDWGNYTPQQQDEIIRRNVAAGLYKGDHGDVVIIDADKAREIKDQVLGANAAPPPAAVTGKQVADRLNKKK